MIRIQDLLKRRWIYVLKHNDNRQKSKLQPPERGPLAASPETAPPSCDVVVDGFIIVIYEAIIAWLRVRARAFPRLSETMLLLPMI